jgi:uncharacterized protein DUF1905
MITVTSPLWRWTAENGSWHFISVLGSQSDEIRAHAFHSPRGFNSVRVEARIGDVAWRTSVFPQKGGYRLRVKAAVRRQASIGAGDEVTVTLALL